MLRKLLDSLSDVLESKDSPMDVKEPIALKFLPSTLLEELHIVKIGQKLETHVPQGTSGSKRSTVAEFLASCLVCVGHKAPILPSSHGCSLLGLRRFRSQGVRQVQMYAKCRSVVKSTAFLCCGFCPRTVWASLAD